MFEGRLQQAQILEDLHDTITCYFPLNFTPPKNDVFKITPEMLKEKLSRCFLVSPLLSSYFYAFLLDKFSAKKSTQLECLDLIGKLTSRFPIKYVKEELR